MASAERKPIMGSGGCAPSGVQEQSPWLGVYAEGLCPSEADEILEKKTISLQ